MAHVLYTIVLWHMYYKSMYVHVCMYVCAIWLVWLEIPQVQMDGCSLVPNCFSLGFGFESLTQSNFCIFVSRCFGIRCKGRGQVGGEDSGGHMRAKQLLQAMIYFRPIWARGCPSNGSHQQCMPRKTTWKGEGEEEDRKNKKKRYDIDWIYECLEWRCSMNVRSLYLEFRA